MVLGKGLITVGMAILAGLCSADITLQQAKDISAAFRLVAVKAGTLAIVGTPPSTNEPTVDEVKYPGCFYLDYIGDVTVVRKSDGAIVKFWIHDISGNDHIWNEQNKLNASQLLSLCQTYRNAAGFTGTLEMVSSFENQDVHPMTFEMSTTLTFNGVGYHRTHLSYFDISHTTGRLEGMDIYDVPTPPSSVTPAITSSQAFATAAAYVNSEYGATSFADLEPAKLCIWKPVSQIPTGQDNFLTSTHATMAANDQGILIWDLFFEVLDDVPGKGGVYSPRYEVHVDAQTGDLLVVYQYMPFGGGGTSVAVTPSPDLGAGPLTIEALSGKRKIFLQSSDLSPSEAPKKRPEGRKIVLKRGRYAMLAWIDLESGLVWTEKSNRRKYARLDHASLKKLRALLMRKQATEPYYFGHKTGQTSGSV